MAAPGVGRGRRRRAPTGSVSTTTGGGRCPTATSSSTRPPRVSFDAPLDAAVEVNLLGPVAGGRRHGRGAGSWPPPRAGPGRATSSRCRPPTWPAPTRARRREELLDARPVHASTSTGAPRSTAARRLRGDLEAESRRPERLAGFTKAARDELGGAGLHLLAERAERLREDWVRKQLVEAGRARAQSLGWPDAYAYTKALGERALVDASSATSSRSPSSARRSSSRPWPSRGPGWIRGFRMAEPIIISYARGLLQEFPGVPEGVVDVIPVDLVVAAIMAVAGERWPPVRRPADAYPAVVYHVASGVRNPLRYGRLVDLVQSWFTEHPALRRRRPAHRGARVVVPRARPRPAPAAPGHHGHGAWPSAWSARCPSAAGRPTWMAALEERHPLAERALGYVELYGAYTETEARYRVDRLLALWDRLDAGRSRRLLLRPGRHRLGPLRPRRPPPVGHRARPGAHRRRRGRP